MWYNLSNTLSHNAFLNMVIGPRGTGKTYALKNHALNNYIKRQEQFIYLRRYKEETKRVRNLLFSDICRDTGYDISYSPRDNGYTLDGELIGYSMSLSDSAYYKSSSYPYVTLIIFDEFIINTYQNMRYLKDEVTKFLDFIETVFRLRDNGKVFMLANSLSFVNPYTLYFNLNLPRNKKWVKTKNNLVLLELVEADNEFITAKQNTLFGQLNKDTQFEEMSVKNKFVLDTNEFIEKKSSNCSYVFTLSHASILYGVWRSLDSDILYVDKNIDFSSPLIYSVTFNDHSANTKLITSKSSGPFGYFITMFKLGRVRFADQFVKSSMMEVLKTCV